MNLEEMQGTWQRLDARVARVEWKGTRGRLMRAPVWEFLAGFGMAMLAGARIEVGFSAVVVLGLGVSAMALAIFHWVMIGGLRWDAPLAQTQAALARVRRARVLHTRVWWFVLLPFWWVFPGLLVQRIFSPGWIAANAVFGLVLIWAFGWGPLRKLWARFEATFAGQTLEEAELEVAEVAAFQAAK